MYDEPWDTTMKVAAKQRPSPTKTTGKDAARSVMQKRRSSIRLTVKIFIELVCRYPVRRRRATPASKVGWMNSLSTPISFSHVSEISTHGSSLNRFKILGHVDFIQFIMTALKLYWGLFRNGTTVPHSSQAAAVHRRISSAVASLPQTGPVLSSTQPLRWCDRAGRKRRRFCFKS